MNFEKRDFLPINILVPFFLRPFILILDLLISLMFPIWNIKLINKKRLDEALQKTDLKNSTQEKEEDIFALTLKKFENFKTLQQISVID